jgi:hypothetical protein
MLTRDPILVLRFFVEVQHVECTNLNCRLQNVDIANFPCPNLCGYHLTPVVGNLPLRGPRAVRRGKMNSAFSIFFRHFHFRQRYAAAPPPKLIASRPFNFVAAVIAGLTFRRNRNLPERRHSSSAQGCQIFIGTKYQNGEKYTKLPRTIPNVLKI